MRFSGFWIIGGKDSFYLFFISALFAENFEKTPGNRLILGQPPLFSVGVDIFGPWNIITWLTSGGAAKSKRWAALFTCFTTRAVHIEVVEEMTFSSFINALRRFIAIIGPVQVYWLDRWRNIIGAAKERRVNVINGEEEHLHNFLNEQRTTYIFNSPQSSHMGGMWERMI